MKSRIAIASALLSLSIAQTMHAAVLHVDIDAPDGGSGASWGAAYNQLQDALAAATPGDEVWIAGKIPAPGAPLESLVAYKPADAGGSRDATFAIPTGVKLYGGFDGTESDVAQRPLGEYFTILSADLNANDNTSRTDNSYHVATIDGANDVVIDGIYFVGGQSDGAFPNDRGGALRITKSSVTIRNASFSTNRADVGGALYAQASTVNIINTGFGPNECTGGGAAILITEGQETNMTNCVMSHNKHIGSNGEAGGLYVSGNTHASLINCTITANETNQTFAGVFVHPAGSADLCNCIIWNNDGDELGGSASITVTSSDIQGGWPGTGNFNADPKFIDVANFNTRLAPDSPCIDRADSSSYNGPLTDGGTLQNRNSLRYIDHPTADNLGSGPMNMLDIGAYEAPCAAATCPADIDRDGFVDVQDLLILLSQWGTCAL